MVSACRRLLDGKEPSGDILERIKRCGEIDLTRLPAPLEGAIELLQWVSDGFTPVLVTRGEEHLQRRKLDALGIEWLFERIWIVDRKDARLFREVISGMGALPETSWVIGDS